MHLAKEERFADAFPDGEVGAISPFGNLCDAPVYVDTAKPELSDRKAGYFTNVDGIDRFVALDPERPEEIIGVVSFDREGRTGGKGGGWP